MLVSSDAPGHPGPGVRRLRPPFLSSTRFLSRWEPARTASRLSTESHGRMPRSFQVPGQHSRRIAAGCGGAGPERVPAGAGTVPLSANRPVFDVVAEGLGDTAAPRYRLSPRGGGRVGWSRPRSSGWGELQHELEERSGWRSNSCRRLRPRQLSLPADRDHRFAVQEARAAARCWRGPRCSRFAAARRPTTISTWNAIRRSTLPQRLHRHDRVPSPRPAFLARLGQHASTNLDRGQA